MASRQNWVLAAGGFGVFDAGINALSILTRILPPPVFIGSTDLFFPANRHAPIAADLTFDTGTRADQLLSAAFDWRETEKQTWQIEVERTDGTTFKLADGGRRFETTRHAPFVGPADEYPDTYQDFAGLLGASQSRMDATSFQLVADAFLVGSKIEVEAFSWVEHSHPG